MLSLRRLPSFSFKKLFTLAKNLEKLEISFVNTKERKLYDHKPLFSESFHERKINNYSSFHHFRFLSVERVAINSSGNMTALAKFK